MPAKNAANIAKEAVKTALKVPASTQTFAQQQRQQAQRMFAEHLKIPVNNDVNMVATPAFNQKGSLFFNQKVGDVTGALRNPSYPHVSYPPDGHWHVTDVAALDPKKLPGLFVRYHTYLNPKTNSLDTPVFDKLVTFSENSKDEDGNITKEVGFQTPYIPTYTPVEQALKKLATQDLQALLKPEDKRAASVEAPPKRAEPPTKAPVAKKEEKQATETKEFYGRSVSGETMDRANKPLFSINTSSPSKGQSR